MQDILKMKIKDLYPNQIITLNDFPVHNEHILKIYFKIFRDGYAKMIPPCPVIEKNRVIEGFNKKLKERFKEFEKKHSKAEYFLLDESHKTTAANLTNNKIKVMIFENEKDIQEAKELEKIGELFSLRVGNNIEIEIKGLKKHFIKKGEGFQTVEEKTKKMVKEELIPSYMITLFKDLK